MSDADDMESDTPGSDDAESSAPQVETTQAFPAKSSRAHGLLRISQPPREGKNESKRMFGHRIFAVVRHVRDRDPPLFASIKIDMIAAGGACSDQANQGMIVEKSVIDSFRNEHREHFDVFRHLLQPVNERDFVCSESLLKKGLGLLFNLDETHFPALHGSLAHQHS